MVTGPTRHRQDPTLAVVLAFLNDTSRELLTIEDPVEYQVEDTNQIQVRPDISLTFAASCAHCSATTPALLF